MCKEYVYVTLTSSAALKVPGLHVSSNILKQAEKETHAMAATRAEQAFLAYTLNKDWSNWINNPVRSDQTLRRAASILLPNTSIENK